jgi:hypothetical protein
MTRNGGNRIAELINLIAILKSLLPPGTIIQPRPDGNLEALYIWLQDLQNSGRGMGRICINRHVPEIIT